MTELLCLHLDRALTEVCAFKLKLKLIVRNQETLPHSLAYHAVQSGSNGR